MKLEMGVEVLVCIWKMVIEKKCVESYDNVGSVIFCCVRR